MSAQALQTVSQVAIFIGVVLTAFGGLGAFYFGKVLDHQKEETAEKNESRLREDVGKLLEGNRNLQQSLDPFEKLAQQLHPSLGREEALETLRGDLKHLQDRAAAIEKRPRQESYPKRRSSKSAGCLRPLLLAAPGSHRPWEIKKHFSLRFS